MFITNHHGVQDVNIGYWCSLVSSARHPVRVAFASLLAAAARILRLFSVWPVPKWEWSVRNHCKHVHGWWHKSFALSKSAYGQLPWHFSLFRNTRIWSSLKQLYHSLHILCDAHDIMPKAYWIFQTISIGLPPRFWQNVILLKLLHHFAANENLAVVHYSLSHRVTTCTDPFYD